MEMPEGKSQLPAGWKRTVQWMINSPALETELEAQGDLSMLTHLFINMFKALERRLCECEWDNDHRFEPIICERCEVIKKFQEWK